MTRTETKSIDKIFLFSVITLLVIGFVVFLSASMGIFASNSASFTSIAFKQGFFGIILGAIACFIFSRIDYKIYKKWALPIFISSIILTLLVFIPHVGATINGAKRWIFIAGISLQPVAILNVGFVIYWSAWLNHVKEKVEKFKYGILPLFIILSIIGVILLKQPDTDSFLIICVTGLSMYIIAGGRWKHLLIFVLIGVIGLGALVASRPYLLSRFKTFVNPAANSLTTSYQLQQSLIAVGSGGVAGRGLGQSIQKYNFLPESISDSIFAVLGEEVGFIGSVLVLFVFLFFIHRGFRIATRAPDIFSGLLVIGIVILITIQSFVNIASTLGIIPFSGIPLAFFSQGGTSMLAVLVQMGIVMNVSKNKTK